MVFATNEKPETALDKASGCLRFPLTGNRPEPPHPAPGSPAMRNATLLLHRLAFIITFIVVRLTTRAMAHTVGWMLGMRPRLRPFSAHTALRVSLWVVRGMESLHARWGSGENGRFPDAWPARLGVQIALETAGPVWDSVAREWNRRFRPRLRRVQYDPTFVVRAREEEPMSPATYNALENL